MIILGALFLLDEHLLGGSFTLGESVAMNDIASAHVRIPIRQSKCKTYPDRLPPGRDEPDPTSPPAMTRTEVEKRR